MTNSPSKVQLDFDRIATVSDEKWNHNSHYHSYLLKHIASSGSDALEIGCGTGTFSRLLAQRFRRVLALDLSPRMIEVAKERSKEILTEESDIDQWDDEDFIVADPVEDVAPQDEPEKLPEFEIAGFWRRLTAFIIDGFILSLPLLIFGFVFLDLAFRLGPWGRPIGFTLFWFYGSLMNSKLRDGQTLGKQVMGIAVVDKEGQYLSLGKAMARASVLTIIGLFNGWSLPLLQESIPLLVANAIIWGGSLALFYGLIFNRMTRQGIHDLLAHSYVIKTPPPADIPAPAIPSIHQRISYGLVVLGLAIGLGAFFYQQNNTDPLPGILAEGEWAEIMNLHQVLMQDGEFFSARVHRNNRFDFGTPTAWKELRIQIWVKTSCELEQVYCVNVLKRVARTALEEYDGIDDLDGMQVVVVSRFDLGITSGNISVNHASTIDDWRAQLSPYEHLR